MDNETINDLWAAVRPYIKTTERMHAADAFVEVLDDYGLLSDLETDIHALEKELKTAVKSHYEFDDNTDDDSE